MYQRGAGYGQAGVRENIAAHTAPATRTDPQELIHLPLVHTARLTMQGRLVNDSVP